MGTAGNQGVLARLPRLDGPTRPAAGAHRGGKCAGTSFISSLTCFGMGSSSPLQILGEQGESGSNLGLEEFSGGTKAPRETWAGCHLQAVTLMGEFSRAGSPGLAKAQT